MELTSNILILNIAFIIIGFYFLIKGSDWFVDSASYVARYYNISEIIIGLTIVSIGTSLPELAANIYASIVGESSISLGNVVGSNIANICLVLGIGGLLTGKIIFNKSILNRDGILMLLSFFMLMFLAIASFGMPLDKKTELFREGYLSRVDGLLFIAVLVIYLYILVKSVISGKDKFEEGGSEEHKTFKNMRLALLFLLIGLVLIFIGAKLLVDNVVWFAVRFNIPHSVIAATIVAFGTSVPELTVTVAGALKGKHDIAVGNIIGSCIFNIAMVLGISLMIRPIEVDHSMIWIVMPIMILSGLLTFLMVLRNNYLNRAKSLILLLIYFVFILYSLSYIL